MERFVENNIKSFDDFSSTRSPKMPCFGVGAITHKDHAFSIRFKFGPKWFIEKDVGDCSKNLVMMNCRFSFVPNFVRSHNTNLCVDCTIEEVNGSVDSFGPELQRDLCSMKHPTGRFNNGSIVSLDVTVLLRNIDST